MKPKTKPYVDKSFLESWAKQRAKGPLRHILISGGLFAVFFYLLYSALELTEHPFATAFFGMPGLKAITIGIFAGFGSAVVQYWAMERSYRKYLKILEAENARHEDADEDEKIIIE